MDDILKKIFTKWFRYKIRKNWSDRINKSYFTTEQEQKLANEIASSVKDSISTVIETIRRELDQEYWFVDTCIGDTIDQIEEEEREKREAEEASQQAPEEDDSEEEAWISDKEIEPGSAVICSYEGRDKCSCVHNKPHKYDPLSCDYDCAYSTDEKTTVTQTACCVPTDKEIEENEEPVSSQEKEILETGEV